MLFIITGSPGAGKTLNTFKEILSNKANFKRPLHYFNIPNNLMDYEYCQTFQAYFYSVYLLELEPDEKRFIQKRVDHIEKRFKRQVELQDFPFLEVAYKTEHSAFNLWFSIINRVAPPHYKALIKNIVDDAKEHDEELTFDSLKKYNFHWNKIDDVQKWHLLEPDSIFVCDEAQEYFPVRIKEKPPEFITAFERHRHSAFDVYLITQSANFIDVHARRLAGSHIHFYRAFNAKTTSRLEWPKVHNPDDYHDKESSQKSRVKNDTRFYGVYRSAVSHTHKFKLPKIFFLLPVALCGIAFSAYSIYGLYAPDDKKVTTQKTTVNPNVPTLKSVAQRGSLTPISDPYLDPTFKSIRKKIHYPQLTCFKATTSNSVDCSCYTQQFTKIKTSLTFCTDFVENGYFDYSLSDKDAGRSTQRDENLNSGGLF
jgi:hypothetical protein